MTEPRGRRVRVLVVAAFVLMLIAPAARGALVISAEDPPAERQRQEIDALVLYFQDLLVDDLVADPIAAAIVLDEFRVCVLADPALGSNFLDVVDECVHLSGLYDLAVRTWHADFLDGLVQEMQRRNVPGDLIAGFLRRHHECFEVDDGLRDGIWYYLLEVRGCQRSCTPVPIPAS